MQLSDALPGEPAIRINAHRWQHALPPGAWPPGFAATGSALRTDVFGVAARWRTGAASTVQLVTAALAWGHGVRGYGPHRTRRILGQDPTGARLDRILHQLQAGEITPDTLIDAYDRFHRTDHLHGLGPAFFTKILYFAGYHRTHGDIQPLILDSVVAGRLPDQAGPANQHTTGWTSATWHRYLQWAANQARRPNYRNEPDLVELSLFTGTWQPERRSDNSESGSAESAAAP